MIALPERERINRELLICKDFMPHIPPLVLKVNIPKSDLNNNEIVNDMIDLLITSMFTVQMFPSLDINVYYIALKMDQSELEKEAKFIEMKIKLVNVESKRVFDPLQKGMFEPFRSKDVQQIMLSKLQRLVNMQLLTKKQIILSIIPMHDLFGIHEIKARWWRNTIF